MTLLLSGTITSKALDLSSLGLPELLRIGAAALGRGDTAEAARCADRMLQLAPLSAPGNALAGSVADARGRHAAAADHFTRAVKADPGLVVAHEGLVWALIRLRRMEEAVRAAEAGLALAPVSAKLSNRRGIALAALGHFREAIIDFERAMSLDPRMASVRWNWGLAQLTIGEFERGWEGFEARRRTTTWDPRPFIGIEPETLADVRGRRVLCYAEQGLGDTLQFIRYAPLLARHAAAVTVEVQPALSGLLKGLSGMTVVRTGDPPPPYDAHVQLMSLPRLFGTRVDTVPWDGPYLRAKDEFIRTWVERIRNDGFRIGVVWQGQAAFEGNDLRSFPAAALAPLAAVPGVRLIALQKGPGLSEIDRLPPGLRIDRLPVDASFDDTAAVMAHCHLVVSACTSPAHLSGALGRPTWIALAHGADWRWMRDRSDSPWYPTARLFRQPKPGDWESVFARMAEELPAFMRRPSH